MDKSSLDLELFDSKPDEVIVPSENIDKSGSKLDSDSEAIEKALLGEKVKLDLSREDLEIYPENYVIDLTNKNGKIESTEVLVLESLKRKGGDIALYLYAKGNGMVFFGTSFRQYLSRILPIVKKYIFLDEIEIYENVERNKPLHILNATDITKQKINL